MNAPSKPSEQTQAGFSEDRRLNAMTLKARLLAGENIPLDELKAFILSAESDLDKNRVKIAKAEKKLDVDFF